MNNVISSFSQRNLFIKYILILLSIQIVNNVLIFGTINTLFKNPGIPQFRLICSVTGIITLIIYVIAVKPSVKELGLYWLDIKKSTQRLYIICGSFLLLMVISSYYIMSDIRYYALLTNIHFGIITPIFEELIFRGYSWNKFREHGFSNFKTLIITSIFFGLFHLGYFFQISYATQFHPEAPSMIFIMFIKIISAIVLGFIFGFIRLKSNKVYGPILLHSILNILSK